VRCTLARLFPCNAAVAERRYHAVAVHGHVEFRPVDRVHGRGDIGRTGSPWTSPSGSSPSGKPAASPSWPWPSVWGCSLIQIHRYESAGAQPTLDVIRRLALALIVSTEELIFGADARGPDDDFRLQFEALADFDPEEKKVAKAVLDSLILKHQARRWASAS
jgi:hypothetical protein